MWFVCSCYYRRPRLPIAGLVFHFSHRNESKPSATQAYADPKGCIQCHAPEAVGYATTGMAHAFYKPQASDNVDCPSRERQFFHPASETYYSMTKS